MILDKKASLIPSSDVFLSVASCYKIYDQYRSHQANADETPALSKLWDAALRTSRRAVKVTKDDLKITSKSTVEQKVTQLLTNMKDDDYLEGDQFDFVEPKASMGIKTIKKTGGNTLVVDPTFLGKNLVGIQKNSTIKITRGTSVILDSKRMRMTVGGYNIELTGMKLNKQTKLFLKDNSLYWSNVEKGQIIYHTLELKQ